MKHILLFITSLILCPSIIMAEGLSDVIEANRVSVFSEKRTYYTISDDVDLGMKTIVLPEGATIDFRGGRLRNGKLECHNNTFIGKSGISPDVTLTGSILGPLDIGVFELKRDNRSFDIGRIINSAGSLCKNLVIPDGRFYFQTPIKIDAIRHYQQFGDLVYNGKAKDVTVFQFYGGNAAIINIYGKIAYDINSKVIDYTKLKQTNIIGVEFVNLNNCSVLVGDVEYFNNNIRVSGYGAGNSYNKYTINISVFSNEHLRIFQKNLPAKQIGWCNENIFIGGRFCNWSHFDWEKCESVAIMIEGAEVGDTYNSANSLLFIKPCMEGFKEYAVIAKNVIGCHWQDMRTEGCGKAIKFIGSSRDNEANSVYGTESIDYTECSTFPLRKESLFPVYSTTVSSSRVVLDVDTKDCKFFRVKFNDPNAKARVGIKYVADNKGQSVSNSLQQRIIRPRSTTHPNSYYYNNNSSLWLLASDSDGCDFVIPDDVGKIQLVLSGKFSGATIYSDKSVQIKDK